MTQTLEHQPQSLSTEATAENEQKKSEQLKKAALDLGAVATSAEMVDISTAAATIDLSTSADSADLATGAAVVDLSTGAAAVDLATGAAAIDTTAESGYADMMLGETIELTKYELLGDALIAYRRAWRGLDLEGGLQNPDYAQHVETLRQELAQRGADAAAQTLSQEDIKALQKKIDEFDDSEIEDSHLLKPHITKQETVGHDATPQKITLIGTVWDITDDPSLGAAIQVMNARMQDSGEHPIEAAAIVRAMNITNDFKAAQRQYSEQTGIPVARPIFAEAYNNSYRDLTRDVHRTETTTTGPRHSNNSELHVENINGQAWSVETTPAGEKTPRAALTESVALLRSPDAATLSADERERLTDIIINDATNTIISTEAHIDRDGTPVDPTDDKDIALAYLLADSLDAITQTRRGDAVPDILVAGLRATVAEAESRVVDEPLLPNITGALDAFEASHRNVSFGELLGAANAELIKDQAHKEAVEVSQTSARAIIDRLDMIANQQ